jgi:hypothetical protein
MNLFKQPKTVDSVLEGFKQTIADLKEVADQNNTLAIQQDVIINDAQAVKAAALDQKERAESAANKIAQFLGL